MRTVHKYRLPIEDEFNIRLPDRASILSFQFQHDKPCIWVLIDPTEKKMVLRKLKLANTGQPITNSSLHYIGTAQMLGGHTVCHLFEV